MADSHKTYHAFRSKHPVRAKFKPGLAIAELKLATIEVSISSKNCIAKTDVLTKKTQLVNCGEPPLPRTRPLGRNSVKRGGNYKNRFFGEKIRGKWFRAKPPPPDSRLRNAGLLSSGTCDSTAPFQGSSAIHLGY